MNSVIIFCAQYLFVLVILGWVVAGVWANKGVRLQFIVATVFAGVIALLLSRVGSALYYDPRPFVTAHLHPLIPHPADNGFPSDHALFTMTLAAITYFYVKRVAFILIAASVIVGVARVLALVHTPLDIVAGWCLGIIGSMVSYYVIRWAFLQYRTSAHIKADHA